MAVMNPPDFPLTGGCLCGAVRFELSALPITSGYCHCKRCQRRSGTAASPQARAAPGSFTLMQGEEQLRTWTPNGGFSKTFCSVCGSSLWSQSPDDPEIRSVRLGVFDGDPGIRPSDRQHLASAAVWEPVPDDDLAHYDGPRP
jgi:hypothetical protein